MDEIRKLRAGIDKVDKEIVRLLSERVKLAEKIGREKQKKSLPVDDPSRQAEVFEHVLSEAKKSGASEGLVRPVFNLIVSHSKAMQNDLMKRGAAGKKASASAGAKVAVLGPEGTFSEEAAVKHFGKPSLVYSPSIQEVFTSLDSGDSSFAVVPIENSLEGSVAETLDCLLKFDLHVVGELVLEVSHNLFLNPSTSIGKVKKIFAHPQASAQCREFLAANFMGVEIVPASSNSGACALAAKEPGSAAIGPLACCGLYRLSLAFSGIQDRKDNLTRFIVVANEQCMARKAPGVTLKTSIILSAKNVPGSLYRALGHFAGKGINLTKIESRPVKDDFGSYVFYIDFMGSVEDENVRSALSSVREDCNFVRVLGAYQAAR